MDDGFSIEFFVKEWWWCSKKKSGIFSSPKRKKKDVKIAFYYVDKEGVWHFFVLLPRSRGKASCVSALVFFECGGGGNVRVLSLYREGKEEKCFGRRRPRRRILWKRTKTRRRHKKRRRTRRKKSAARVQRRKNGETSAWGNSERRTRDARN